MTSDAEETTAAAPPPESAHETIVCVNPNVSIDHTMVVEAFEPSAVLRTDQTLKVAGGKGFNVARSLRLFGHRPVVVGMIGGEGGRLVADLARREGFEVRWTGVAGETRTCVIIVSQGTGQATVVNEAGPGVSAQEWLAFTEEVVASSVGAQAVCLSGSLPPGDHADQYGELISRLVSAGSQVYVDTSAESLASAVARHPTGVKVNAEEAQALLGAPVGTFEEAAAAAQTLVEGGITYAVITLGKAGAVLAHGESVIWAEAPEVQTFSAVGSGDAFLAGFVAAQVEGAELDVALRRGVAAGTANAQSPWGGTFQMQDFESALERIHCRHATPAPEDRRRHTG